MPRDTNSQCTSHGFSHVSVCWALHHSPGCLRGDGEVYPGCFAKESCPHSGTTQCDLWLCPPWPDTPQSRRLESGEGRRAAGSRRDGASWSRESKGSRAFSSHCRGLHVARRRRPLQPHLPCSTVSSRGRSLWGRKPPQLAWKRHSSGIKRDKTSLIHLDSAELMMPRLFCKPKTR